MKKILPFFALLFWASVSSAQWTDQSSGSTHWMNSLYFIDHNTGWICGYNGSDNMLLHTTDGGVNWIPQNMPVTSFISEVTFVNATTGWAVGVDGTIMKSTDSGETWVAQTIATTKAVQSVYFVDENTGWVVGQSGIVFHSTDGGTTWNPQTSGVSNRLIRVRFLNSQVGWASGWGGAIIYTADGGTTWTQQTSPSGFDLISISIIDENNVWISGNLGGGGKGAANTLFDNGHLIHTSDGGATWEFQRISTEYINAVSFVDLMNGWSFGSGGNIFHTNDGGVTWHQQLSGGTDHLVMGQFTDIMNGWVTGADGVIKHTGNGGTTVGINEFETKNSLNVSNEPNPFTESTKISYSVSEAGIVEISIYDSYGKKISTLLNENMPAGNHTSNWDASAYSAGMYFCIVKAGAQTVTQKMIKR